jgi:plasmid maintenance system antidote protein VapI
MLHTNIQRLIKSQYLFQADFADEVGANESRVSRAIRGRILIRPDEADQWSEALSCDVELLSAITRTEETQ